MFDVRFLFMVVDDAGDNGDADEGVGDYDDEHGDPVDPDKLLGQVGDVKWGLVAQLFIKIESTHSHKPALWTRRRRI